MPHGLRILAPICGYFALAAFIASAVLTWRYAREVGGEGQSADPGFGKRRFAIDL